MPPAKARKELKELMALAQAQAIAAAKSLDMEKIQAEMAPRSSFAPLSRDALGHLIEDLIKAGYLEKAESAYILTEKAKERMKGLGK